MRTKRLLFGLLIVTLLALLVLPGIAAASPSTSGTADKAPPADRPVVSTSKPLLPADSARPSKPLLAADPARPSKTLAAAGPARSPKPLQAPVTASNVK